jgi:hypothetical protein
MLLGPALTDDTVLHLAAQILDEPRSASLDPLAVSTTSKEQVP